MRNSIGGRISNWSSFASPRVSMLFVSDPPTVEEKEAIATAVGPIVIVPHVCKTANEWVAKHAARQGGLQ